MNPVVKIPGRGNITLKWVGQAALINTKFLSGAGCGGKQGPT